MTGLIPDSLLRAPRRAEMFAFIKAELAEGHPFPSSRAIADHMNWKNEGSVASALLALCSLDGVLEAYVDEGKRLYRLKEPI